MVDEARLHLGAAAVLGHHDHRGTAGLAGPAHHLEDLGQGGGGELAVQEEHVGRAAAQGLNEVRGTDPLQVESAREVLVPEARGLPHHERARARLGGGARGGDGGIGGSRLHAHVGSTNL